VEFDDPKGIEILIEGRAKSVHLMANDVLVLPEHFGLSLRRPQVNCRVVIFNQNVHYMFTGLKPGGLLEGSFCADESVPSIVVSRHNYEYLRYAFPRREVHLTTNGIDGTHFFFQREKKKQIAYMPRKLPNDLAHVLAILKLRGALNGWELCPLDGLREEAVAERMRESLVFLSSCSIEGFGLPPLEALLSGCVVVGYTGAAAAEFLNDATGFPIPQEDRLAFARRLETVLADLSAQPDAHLERASQIAQRLREQYSLEQERTAILDAWRKLAPDHDPDRALV
jgi:glycosyltransferase involved in cell wall biosynthesis